MSEITLGDQKIGPNESTFIIAEAGSNHNGDIEIAKELIDVAADAGADAVKFQTFRASDLYVDDRDIVDDPTNSTYALLENLEHPYDWIPELYEHCRSRGVHFMSTPFDERSAAKIAEYVPVFKVASFTLSHHPFLEELSEYNKPVIMSTGAHGREEINEAVAVLRANGVEDIALLHCVSSYPTPLEEINVRAVQTLDREFGTIVGFSDHTTNPVTAPAAAVALGASIIEKHFTLDKGMEGPDHSFALEPDELEKMVGVIRKTERALGDGSITVSEVESDTVERSRRLIVASRRIERGEPINREAVQILRPGDIEKNGLPPSSLEKVVRSTAAKVIPTNEPIKQEDLIHD